MKTINLPTTLFLLLSFASLNFLGYGQQFTNSYQKNLIVYGQRNTITIPVKYPEKTSIYATTSNINEVSPAWANPYFSIKKTEVPGTYTVEIQSEIPNSNEPFDMSTNNGRFIVLDGNDTVEYYFSILYPKIKTDIVLSTGFDKRVSISKIDSTIRVIAYCSLEQFPSQVLKSPEINEHVKVVSYTLYASGAGFPNVKIFTCSGDRLPSQLINQIQDPKFRSDKESYLTFENIKVSTPKGLLVANPMSISLTKNN